MGHMDPSIPHADLGTMAASIGKSARAASQTHNGGNKRKKKEEKKRGGEKWVEGPLPAAAGDDGGQLEGWRHFLGGRRIRPRAAQEDDAWAQEVAYFPLPCISRVRKRVSVTKLLKPLSYIGSG